MSTDHFELVSPFQPTGDQPEAIEALVKSIEAGNRMQTLKGVTGSGKTFTMANIIQRLNRPTLVLAHNKTLAAQLCSEFKEFFPRNAVEYFVSYYDSTNPKLTLHPPIPTLKRTVPSMTKLKSCGTLPPHPSRSVEMSLSFPLSPAFTR